MFSNKFAGAMVSLFLFCSLSYGFGRKQFDCLEVHIASIVVNLQVLWFVFFLRCVCLICMDHGPWGGDHTSWRVLNESIYGIVGFV